jgi:hypothetical protein
MKSLVLFEKVLTLCLVCKLWSSSTLPLQDEIHLK